MGNIIYLTYSSETLANIKAVIDIKEDKGNM